MHGRPSTTDEHRTASNRLSRDTAIAALDVSLRAFMWVGMAIAALAVAIGF